MIHIARSSKKRSPRIRAFDLTPMIDVVLQLIIFFMFTSQFGQVSRSEVDLPAEAGEERPDTAVPSVVVDIGRNGALSLDGKPATVGTIQAFVARQKERAGGETSGISVLIRADRSAPAAQLNRLADELARLGVRRWAIATREPGQGSTP